MFGKKDNTDGRQNEHAVVAVKAGGVRGQVGAGRQGRGNRLAGASDIGWRRRFAQALGCSFRVYF